MAATRAAIRTTRSPRRRLPPKRQRFPIPPRVRLDGPLPRRSAAPTDYRRRAGSTTRCVGQATCVRGGPASAGTGGPRRQRGFAYNQSDWHAPPLARPANWRSGSRAARLVPDQAFVVPPGRNPRPAGLWLRWLASGWVPAPFAAAAAAAGRRVEDRRDGREGRSRCGLVVCAQEGGTRGQATLPAISNPCAVLTGRNGGGRREFIPVERIRC